MDKDSVFLPFRFVAQFADDSRLLFNGFTEEECWHKICDAQKQHGDVSWYDGVTDLHYEHGRYYATIPQPPSISIIEKDGCALVVPGEVSPADFPLDASCSRQQPEPGTANPDAPPL